MQLDFDINALETPYYIVDEVRLENNLKKLKNVSDRTGCKILLAQKAFSMYSLYPLIRKYLAGTTASGLYEAKLGSEEMGGETHVFSPAYKKSEMDELLSICDHIVFNSPSQWKSFSDIVVNRCSAGLRINPEFSTQNHAIYDPCSKYSRLGVTKANFSLSLMRGINGFHMHTLCEQDAEPLVKTFEAFEKNFGEYFCDLEWLNLGGGHHITRDGYDTEKLCSLLEYIKSKYKLQVYLEPGEAVALNSGFLVSTVMDIIDNGMKIAILDTSAACHMPDVLEMPYRPEIVGAALPNVKKHTYRLGGPTCLAGDIIGDYSFDEPLNIGDRLVFCDMAHYSMVKNNTFNGMPLPSIASVDKNKNVKLIKKFGYPDFKNRL